MVKNAPTITTLVSPDFKVATIEQPAGDLAVMNLHMVDSLMVSREAIAVQLDAASGECEKQTETIKLLADQGAVLAGEVIPILENSSLRGRLEVSERARTEGIEALRRERLL